MRGVSKRGVNQACAYHYTDKFSIKVNYRST